MYPNKKIKQHSVKRCFKRAFTLIELLAVIAVVVVLMVIIVPVVGSARESASSTQCASNIRQVASAILLYASENNNLFPPASDSVNRKKYSGSLIHYGYVEKGSNVFGCPLDRNYYRVISAGYMPSTYALMAPIMTPSIPDFTVARSIFSVSNPARTGMLTEWTLPESSNVVDVSTDSEWYGAVDQNSMVNSTSGHRNGARHVAFVDGHVEYLSIDQLATSSSIWDGGLFQNIAQ